MNFPAARFLARCLAIAAPASAAIILSIAFFAGIEIMKGDGVVVLVGWPAVRYLLLPLLAVAGIYLAVILLLGLVEFLADRWGR